MRSLDNEKLSKAVILKRDKKGLSIRPAAIQAGVPFSTLHRIEQGQTPDVNTLIKVLDWLKMGIGKFIKEDKV